MHITRLFSLGCNRVKFSHQHLPFDVLSISLSLFLFSLCVNRCTPTPQSWQLLSVTQFAWQRIVSEHSYLKRLPSIPLVTKAQFKLFLPKLFSDSLRKDEKIGVLNRGRLYTPTGKESSITGYAYMTDPKEPGKLTLHLDGVPFLGSCKCRRR